MPGSPPSKTTDPGTIPPPRTRSNSLKPLVNLDIFFDEISLNGIDFLLFFLFLIFRSLTFYFFNNGIP